jgi:pimeloyl-ACP methyl ester carboxylesterase
MRHDEGVPQPTIVLLHGQPDSSASFWALRRALRGRVSPEVRIGVPDRPGYGANGLAATDYRGNVEWLTRWMERFCPGPVILVGHSWAGGVAALAAAERVSTRIVGLVLLASVGPECLVRMDPVLAAPVLGELISFSTLRIGRGPIAHKAATLIGGNLDSADLPYARSSGAAMRFRPLWRSFLTEQRALLRDLPMITAALPDIATPTRIITGDQDQVIPERTPAALQAAISASQWVHVDAGHDLQLRQPVVVADEIAAFAAEVLSESSVLGELTWATSAMRIL